MSVSKLVSVREAVERIESGQTVAVGGSGHLLQVPDGVLAALGARYRETGAPAGLTVVHTMGIGDNADRGMGRLAYPGLVRRFIGSHYGHNPEIMRLIADDEVEALGIPGGTLSLLYREIAGGRPGLVTKVGLGTFVDPRVDGGRLNARTDGAIAEVVELAGDEWLFYPSFPIDVGIIRATTSDTRGNLTMEDEAGYADNLALASAVHNSGGHVIAEVKRLAEAGSLPPRSVRVPGILVDAVVVDPLQHQTGATVYSPYLAGTLRAPGATIPRLEQGPRKLIARRAAEELHPGDIVNLGFGVSSGVASILAEEGCYDEVSFSIEQGIVGGVPGVGLDSGTAVNAEAYIDEGAQFDLYDGGALDVACVAFGEVDARGDVNVSKLGARAVGPGGFINITQNAHKVVFCGTLTGGGLEVSLDEEELRIVREGRYRKFVARVDHITFAAGQAGGSGREVVYVTERAVFRLTREGLLLTEVAPGIDPHRDVIEQMGFRPALADPLATMDTRLLRDGPMGRVLYFEPRPAR
jgi:acyl CoA:acetate/3-ketoacid CoA transferase